MQKADPLALLIMLVSACLTGALPWLDAPMYLTIPLGLGQIVAWMAAFPLRCMFFCWEVEEHERKMDWCLLLEKCRSAFPLQIPIWVIALILGCMVLYILAVCLIGLLIKLLFGL